MSAHIADVESDLSAIHRIDDPYRQEAPRMFRLAYRLAHYQGCIRNDLLNRAKPEPKPRAPEYDPGTTWIPSTPEALANSPLSRYVSTTVVAGSE